MSNGHENDSAVMERPTGQMAFGDKGLVLTSFDDFWRFAQMVKRSGMVDHKRTPESIMISVQKGAELGLSYLDSVHLIPTVKGRPTIEGKGVLALIQGRNVDDRRGPIDCGCRGEGDDRVGWCKSWRRGWPEPRESTFTWKQAVNAGLTKPRGTGESIYKLYGERMLQWKAVAIHGDRYYGDVLHGIMDTMTAHEVYDEPAEIRDVTPAAVPGETAPEPSAVDPLLAIGGGDEPVDVEESEPVTAEPEAPDEPIEVLPPEEPDEPEAPPEPEAPLVCGKGPAGSECMQDPGHDGDCDWVLARAEREAGGQGTLGV